MLLKESELPNWFSYPNDFLVLVEQNLLDFDPWIILKEDRLKVRFEGIKSRYPDRKLLPFARREDNDDVACWESDNLSVVIIHDFASKGHEGGNSSMIFWDWFRLIVENMIEHNQ